MMMESARTARDVRDAIAAGYVCVARDLLRTSHSPLEIDSLLDAGMNAEAIRRLDLVITPKFASVEACEAAYRAHQERAPL